MAEKERSFNLRIRKPKSRPTVNECQEPSTSAKKGVRKTPSEYQKTWLENLKTNPVKYQAHRSYETIRTKVWRATLSEEKKAEQREKTRIRVARKRAKDRAAQQALERSGQPAPPPAKKTRSAVVKQRKIWNDAQQRCRDKKTPQQKRRHLEKRRKTYAEKVEEKRAKAEQQKEKAASKCSSAQRSYLTTNGLKQAIKRVKKKMPSSSEKTADVIEQLINTATPKSKACLKKKYILSPKSKKRIDFMEKVTSNYRTTMTRLHKKRSTKALHQKQLLTAAALTSKKYVRKHMVMLGLRYKTMKKTASSLTPGLHPRKRRSDALDPTTVREVEVFYNRGDISRALPDARSAKCGQKNSVVGRRVMERSIQSAHKQFMAEHPDKHLSFSTFSKLRPKHITTMNNNQREACLCEYCINVDFKLQALGTFCSLHKLGQCIISDRYDASKRTLCPKDGANPKKACLDRNCTSCGVDMLDNFLQPLTAAYGDNTISWYRWQTGNVRYGDNMVRRMIKEKKSGTVQQIIKELKTELMPLSNHLFNAFWQWMKYNEVCVNLPENWVVFCSDFAENYTCRAQDEAQGAHWSNVQCTIHPIVATYRCPLPECQTPITDTIMFISDDIKHCYHAVHHFTKEAVKQLQEDGIVIDKLIQFSDGAPTQYKCKVNFCDMSFSNQDFGFPTERHYFGSRHGKGPCDREIGVLKKQVNLSVKARLVEVGSAKELYQYGKQQLSRPKPGEEHVHSKRRFIFVEHGEILRDRPDHTNVKPLKGTMKVHSVRGLSPYVVASRERSCFCDACTTNKGVCSTTDLVGAWEECNIARNGNLTGREPQPPEEHQPPAGPPDDHVTPSSGEGSIKPPQPGEDTQPREHNAAEQRDPVNIKDGEPQENQFAADDHKPPCSGEIPLHQYREDQQPCPLTEEPQPSGKEGNVVVAEQRDKVNAKGGESKPTEEIEVDAAKPQGRNYKVGDYVAVIFNDSWWPGEMTDINDDMCLINFMAPKGANKYVWPSPKDEAWVNKHGIFMRMPSPPVPLSYRYMRFDDDVIEAVTSAVEEYLQEN